MKKILPVMTFAIVLGLILNACSVNKVAFSEAMPATQNLQTSSASCYVELKDKSIVSYQTLQMIRNVFNDAYLLANGKTKIYPKEIRAYQTNNYYAVSQSVFVNGRKSQVSVDCLPGFAVRIARGKINLYCKKFYNGTYAVDEFYIQSGDNGEIIAYTPSAMNEMLKGFVEAVGFFDGKLKKAELAKKLLAMADIINNDHLVTKN